MKKQKRPAHYWRDRMRKYRRRKGMLLKKKERAAHAAWYMDHKSSRLSQIAARRTRLRADGRCLTCRRKRPADLAAYCRTCQDAKNKAR